MTIENFSTHLYRGTIIELTGVGVSDDSNPIVYVGNIEDMPEEYLSCDATFIAVSGDKEYTLRIESYDLPKPASKDGLSD